MGGINIDCKNPIELLLRFRHIPDDTYREIFLFFNLSDIPIISLVDIRYSKLSEPLRHIFSPRFIEPLIITGSRCSDGPFEKNLIQYRDHVSSKELGIPTTGPPTNIIGFEYISINDYIGKETMQFLSVS